MNAHALHAAMAERFLAILTALDDRVAAHRGSPLTEAELERLAEHIDSRIHEIGDTYAARLRGARDDEAAAIIEAWFADVVAPIARAGVNG